MSLPHEAIIFMEKAVRACRSARALSADNDFDGACNRAYYAMHDAARAALIVVESPAYTAKTHSGLISAFHRDLIKPDFIAKEHGTSISRAEHTRLAADYSSSDHITADVTDIILAEAEAFVAAVTDRFFRSEL
jgi:uncharacterized protein (UPF0332 family)